MGVEVKFYTICSAQFLVLQCEKESKVCQHLSLTDTVLFQKHLSFFLISDEINL